MSSRGGPARGDEVFPLDLDDPDVDELERRLEMSVAAAGECPAMTCNVFSACECPRLSGCAVFCDPT